LLLFEVPDLLLFRIPGLRGGRSRQTTYADHLLRSASQTRYPPALALHRNIPQACRRSLKLWFIDGDYHTVQFVLFGLILES
jgi:hypothetical protein